MRQITVTNLYRDLEHSINELRENHEEVLESRRIVERQLATGGTFYGINTGFGVLARKRIDDRQVLKLQKNLILSHSVGVGDPVPREISRLMLDLKIHSLGMGYSGISPQTFRRLIEFSRRGLVPVVPSRGSVGASGDLAPLAHLSLPLLGQGFFWDDEGRVTRPAGEVLRKLGLKPVVLQAKDGLSLINGTQFMTAYGAWVLEKSLRLLTVADIVAGMSLEALQGSVKPFTAEIQRLRPHPGQALAAENIRMLLAESEILESHRDCGKVQDPYCLRCVPQVHGASRDAVGYAVRVVETEMNSVTDNPLVFRDGTIISGGNFHGQPVALALDLAAIALAELAAISERRTYLLLAGHDDLPPLLMRETGINSGFMIPQYTAAALVSENKILCHPASVDSIPTSLGQEDHVSMGSISALKLFQVFHNVQNVLAVELFTSSQALDYRHPLRAGRGVEAAHGCVRAFVPHREADDFFQDDMTRCSTLIDRPEFIAAVKKATGELH